jgi:penicillin-binding protein 1A
LVGGRETDPGEFNRATQARRQTGSAIKPVVYAAAFTNAFTALTPASTVPNELRTYGKGRYAWSPHNDGDRYTPTVTLANALARSLNVATANVVEMIGPQTVARMAEQFGLGRLKPVMSIGLGTNEVTLLDLTSAYSVFADRGMRREPSPIRAVIDSRGTSIFDEARPAVEVVPPAIAALMTGLLEDVVQYGVAYPLRAYYGFDRPVAGKTGTTNDYRDAWFVGYTPYLIAGIWVGFDRPRSLGRQAAHTALPVWAAIMQHLVGTYPPTPFTSDLDLEYRPIDPWNGYLADAGGCPAMWVPFLPGTTPLTLCSAGAADTGWVMQTPDSLYMADTVAVYHDEEAEPADTSWKEVPPDTTVDVDVE